MLARHASSKPELLDVETAHPEFLVVRFPDQSLLESENVESTGAALTHIVEQYWQPQMVLLNFAKIEHIDSLFLGTLIVLHERLKADDRRLILCNLAPHLDEAMYLTRLDLILDIWDNEETVLEELSHCRAQQPAE